MTLCVKKHIGYNAVKTRGHNCVNLLTKQADIRARILKNCQNLKKLLKYIFLAFFLKFKLDFFIVRLPSEFRPVSGWLDTVMCLHTCRSPAMCSISTFQCLFTTQDINVIIQSSLVHYTYTYTKYITFQISQFL